MSTKVTPFPAELVEPGTWNNLISLNKKQGDDRQIIQSYLAAWSAGQDSLPAALYIDEDSGQWHRVAAVGAEGFPDDPQDPGEGWQYLELPGAALVYGATETALEAADPALLLLAAGARISGLKKTIQEQSFQARFRGVEIEALYDVGLAIASTLDLDELGEEVLMRAVSLLDARRGALFLLEDGRFRLNSRFGGRAREEISLAEIDLQHLEEPGEEATELIPGTRYQMAVPVEIDGEPKGLLVVADKESRSGVGPFPAKDRRTLSLFANQAAIALENAKLHRLALEKERLEREMELAAEIQQRLLPKTMPEIAGFEIIGWNRPARQVGGDYFDFQELEDGRLGMVVGDVTGKGMPAALLVSTLHSALRVLLDRMEIGSALVERLNRHVFESSAANKFITMLLAALDPRNSQLTYINAGHNPGLLIRRNGQVEELTSGGLPLGLLPDGGAYGASVLELDEGDLVCIYSDGITECEACDEEQYGLERLIELLQDKAEQPLMDLIDHIDQTMIDFAQGQPQGDDQTVVLLRRRG